MYAAFPRSEYLWASPTSTVASASLRMVLSVGLLGPHANQDGGGSPRFLTLPFPDVPCSKTPPQSPAIIANSDHLLLPSRYSTLSACGCRLTRLNRYRGRDGHYWPPPAQIRTRPTKASGSYL